MIARRKVLAQFLFAPLLAAPAGSADEFRRSTPEEQGVDSVALAEALEQIVQKRIPIHSLLVVRHGALVMEAYFYPYEPTVPHDVASVTKSVTSMLTGIAIDKGYLKGPDEPVLPLLKAVPSAPPDVRRSRITVGHLLTMTSGLACGEVNAAQTAEPELAAMRRSTDWIRYAENIPMRSQPGSEFAYCSVNNHLLSAVLTAVSGESLEAFARRHLFAPLGIRAFLWPADPKGFTYGWADLHLYPRDMAKLGYLYLHRGKWEGRQVVPEDWVRKSIQPRVPVRKGVAYGYSWWINVDRSPHIPEAEGRGGQRISIVPDKDAVVVFTSGGADTDEVAPYILGALRSDVRLSQNPAGCERLAQALKAATLPPKPAPVPRLPDTARRISGRRYIVGANPLDFHGLRLVFDGEKEARVAVDLGGERWTGPVGLDGVYRFSPNGHLRLPMAVSGTWRTETEFLLDVNLFPNITRILISVRYTGDRAELHVTDTTGSFHDLKLTATSR